MRYLFEKLYGDIPDDRILEAQAVINNILSISISEVINWYNYILGDDSKLVNYYTFHGTKGLEFENVGVIITNSFNRKCNYYHSFFEQLDICDKTEDFIEKKNLLYVSITRTKKNLRVLYLDSNFDAISSNFNYLFKDSKEFKMN